MHGDIGPTGDAAQELPHCLDPERLPKVVLCGEDETGWLWSERPQQIDGTRSERNAMCNFRLVARRRDDPAGLLKVDFLPMHAERLRDPGRG
jgi:hypothetical protein